jgi:hypothetical protein
MEANDLVAHNIRSWLDIARYCDCSSVVVFNELIGTPDFGFWIISAFIDFEEIYVLNLDAFIRHQSHILQDNKYKFWSQISCYHIQLEQVLCDCQTMLSIGNPCSIQHALQLELLVGSEGQIGRQCQGTIHLLLDQYLREIYWPAGIPKLCA